MSLKKPDIDFGGTTDQVDWYPECGMWGLRNKDALNSWYWHDLDKILTISRFFDIAIDIDLV